jgi:uroporphyrinogen-III synthase
VIEIEALPFKLPERDFAAIVFTSANGVRVAAAHEPLKASPVFAVGTRTAEVARECGFRNVGTAAGDVNALADLLLAELAEGAHVLHLAGEDRAGDLPGRLASRGITVETKAIYRARVSAKLKPETVSAFRVGRIGAVLHYSERSAAAFVRLADAAAVGDDIRKTRHLCLSPQVAAPLKLFGATVAVAEAPEEDALFALLGL